MTRVCSLGHPRSIGLPNTMPVGQIGSATRKTRDAMTTVRADNVIAVLSGEEPPTPVV
jgi:glyoxylate reductase